MRDLASTSLHCAGARARKGKWILFLKQTHSLQTTFSKHAHCVGAAGRAGYQVGPDVKPEIDWTNTARRIGKCLIGNSISIVERANQSNPDINDEDFEMGVEHGKAPRPIWRFSPPIAYGAIQLLLEDADRLHTVCVDIAAAGRAAKNRGKNS
jgi:hypothetical protein